MDFGEALRLLKMGCRVAREGWNGKGMFIYLAPGKTVETTCWGHDFPYRKSGDSTDADWDRGYIKIRPHIDMVNAQGERIIGWLASQTDMLETDWYVVEDVDRPVTDKEIDKLMAEYFDSE